MPAIRTPSAIAVAILSLLAVFFYTRANILYAFYANAPSRLERINNLRNHDIRFRDVVRNCEDVVLDTDQGIALLSCDPGRDTWNTVMGTFVDSKPPPETGLYLWNYADSGASNPPRKLKLLDFNDGAEHFHPLGLEYHASSNSIFVANHAPTGTTLEIFKLFPAENAATHVGTIKHDLLKAPNSIAAINDVELFVTNDHYFRARYNPMLAMIETYSGIPGGSVVHVDVRSIRQPKVTQLARVPFANGVVELNGTALAVASTNMLAIYIYPLDRNSNNEAPRLGRKETIPVPFHPDNLSVDKNGKLLIAGHPHSPTISKVAKNNARCNEPGKTNGEGCVSAASWLAEWSEYEGLKTLFVGNEYGTTCTAVRDVDRKVGIATGLYERGILAWDE